MRGRWRPGLSSRGWLVGGVGGLSWCGGALLVRGGSCDCASPPCGEAAGPQAQRRMLLLCPRRAAAAPGARVSYGVGTELRPRPHLHIIPHFHRSKIGTGHRPPCVVDVDGALDSSGHGIERSIERWPGLSGSLACAARADGPMQCAAGRCTNTQPREARSAARSTTAA